MSEPTVVERIEEALQSWDRTAEQQRVAEAEVLRQHFIEQVPVGSWAELPLESYALGQQSRRRNGVLVVGVQDAPSGEHERRISRYPPARHHEQSFVPERERYCQTHPF